MSNFSRLSEERPVILTGVYGPSSIILPVSTGIRLLGSAPVPVLLNAGLSYTSDVFDVSYFKYITGTVFADQNGTLHIEQSPDGTNFDGPAMVSYFASQPTKFKLETVAPFARVRFVNGPVDQTVFRLYFFGKLV